MRQLRLVSECDRFHSLSRHTGPLCAFEPRRISNRGTAQYRGPPVLTPAARYAQGFGTGAQAGHGPDAEEGADGERGEGEAPADGVDHGRHQMHGGQRQQEAEAGLHGQHGADRAGLGRTRAGTPFVLPSLATRASHLGNPG